MSKARMKPMALLLSCALLLAAAQPQERTPGRVVLVSIDGFAAFHLADAELLLPNIRALASDGVAADSSETVFPSVTHPAHTTLVTGVAPRVHGVLSNTMRNRVTGQEFHVTNRPRAESVRVATLFDAAAKKGLVTAAFFWPETRGDPAVRYNLAEVLDRDGRADPSGADPKFLALLRQAAIPIDRYYAWYPQPTLKTAADGVLAEAAAWTIRDRKPHLLAIHLLATDGLQHAYGPGHYLARAALTAADHAVGLLKAAVDDAGLGSETTFVIAADHGFATARWDANLAPLVEEAGLSERVRLHPGGWGMAVETLAGFRPERDQPALERLFQRALKVSGVARLYRPEDMHALGLPRYEEDPHVLGQYLLVGDIDTHLIARLPGKAERAAKPQPYHGHGALPSEAAMFPALVLSGRGIRRGGRIGHTSNYHVAPTIAHLLGVELPAATGRVLREALER